MKKAILTIGFFTLVLVSTSFASPTTPAASTDNTSISNIDGNGGQSTGGNRKVDYNGGSLQNQIIMIDGNGGQSTGGNRKVD